MTREEIFNKIRMCDKTNELKELTNQAMDIVFRHNLDKLFNEDPPKLLNKKFLEIMDKIRTLLNIKCGDGKEVIILYDNLKKNFFKVVDTAI
jgi:hypothetical protein